jgi:hypothetical protein
MSQQLLQHCLHVRPLQQLLLTPLPPLLVLRSLAPVLLCDRARWPLSQWLCHHSSSTQIITLPP